MLPVQHYNSPLFHCNFITIVKKNSGLGLQLAQRDDRDQDIYRQNQCSIFSPMF